MDLKKQRDYVFATITADTLASMAYIDPLDHHNLIMPKEMKDLLIAIPELKKETTIWKYSPEEGDFVQMKKPRSVKQYAHYFLDCVINPRELCSRQTLMSLAPFIFVHMRIPPSMVASFAFHYTCNIVERAFDT